MSINPELSELPCIQENISCKEACISRSEAGGLGICAVGQYIRGLHQENDQLYRENRQLRTENYYDSLVAGVMTTAGVEHLIDEDNNFCEEILNQSVGVYFLDLRALKLMNDEISHKAGDNLLIAFGERIFEVLAKTVRQDPNQGAPGRERRENSNITDIVERLSGDEFIIITRDTNSHDQRNIEERIKKEFSIQSAKEKYDRSEVPLMASVTGVHATEVELELSSLLSRPSHAKSHLGRMIALADKRHTEQEVDGEGYLIWQGAKNEQYEQMRKVLQSRLHDDSVDNMPNTMHSELVSAVEGDDNRKIASVFFKLVFPDFYRNASKPEYWRGIISGQLQHTEDQPQ